METVLLVLGGVAVYTVLDTVHALYFSEEARARRTICAEQRVRIARAEEQARVRVVGLIQREGASLVAPFSGKPCVAYDVRVEALVRSVGGTSAWATMIRERKLTEVRVEDRTGVAVLDVERVDMTLLSETDYTSRKFRHLGAPLRAFLEKHGISSTRTELRFTEGILEEGEKIAVSGVVMREPFHEGDVVGYRETATRVRIVAGADPILVNDDPDAFL